jgi:hypothetical protein
MTTIKDGTYRISYDGKHPPFLTVKIKGDEATYADGSKGPVSTIESWEMEGIDATTQP